MRAGSAAKEPVVVRETETVRELAPAPEGAEPEQGSEKPGKEHINDLMARSPSPAEREAIYNCCLYRNEPSIYLATRRQNVYYEGQFLRHFQGPALAGDPNNNDHIDDYTEIDKLGLPFLDGVRAYVLRRWGGSKYQLKVLQKKTGAVLYTIPLEIAGKPILDPREREAGTPPAAAAAVGTTAAAADNVTFARELLNEVKESRVTAEDAVEKAVARVKEINESAARLAKEQTASMPDPMKQLEFMLGILDKLGYGPAKQGGSGSDLVTFLSSPFGLKLIDRIFAPPPAPPAPAPVEPKSIWGQLAEAAEGMRAIGMKVGSGGGGGSGPSLMEAAVVEGIKILPSALREIREGIVNLVMLRRGQAPAAERRPPQVKVETTARPGLTGNRGGGVVVMRRGPLAPDQQAGAAPAAEGSQPAAPSQAAADPAEEQGTTLSGEQFMLARLKMLADGIWDWFSHDVPGGVVADRIYGFDSKMAALMATLTPEQIADQIKRLADFNENLATMPDDPRWPKFVADVLAVLNPPPEQGEAA